VAGEAPQRDRPRAEPKPLAPADFRIVEPPPAPPAQANGNWFWVALLALILFAAPFAVRWFLYGNQTSIYVPPAQSAPQLAMTPEPTATAWAVDGALRGGNTNVSGHPQGPVVIDYAHFNQIDARGMQPLAAALARHGLSTRVWLTEVDPFAVSSSSGFPDQSKELAEQLRDASAIIIISPFFLWTPEEIALLERFVADGGRALLISDPDIYGDAAVYMNLISEPFGVVFNDDYLYDTIRNDENFTHFFQGEFLDQAAALDGLEVAFYGARSISGDVIPQAISAPTTLSSRRTGVSGFTTLAIGDNRGWQSGGRVLALSDFDVLTEPNVVRHDNQQIVEFVAQFLADAERTASIADFPAWLDRDVTLMIGSADGLDADTLLVGAKLQRRLEESGRHLLLAGAPVSAIPTLLYEEVDSPSGAVPPGATIAPTETAEENESPAEATMVTTSALPFEGGTIPPLPAEEPADESAEVVSPVNNDLILLADYEYADEETRILALVGISLEVEYVTPTPSANGGSSATATPTPTPNAATTVTVTVDAPTAPLEGTATPESDATPEAPSNWFGNLDREQAPPPAGTPPGAPTEEGSNEGSDGVSDAEATAEATPKPGATETATPSPTSSPTATATPTATPTPIEVLWLVAEDGLRLLADQTVLVIRTTEAITGTGASETESDVAAGTASDRNAVIVLGSRAAAINAGVTRLLGNDFSDCIVGSEVTYCPIAPEAGSGGTTRANGNSSSGATSTPGSAATPGGLSTPAATPNPGSSDGAVLLVDDNTAALEGETSEADHYLRALTAHGVSPTLWNTESEGLPTANQLNAYKWVIWSNASYAQGELSVEALDPLLTFINEGGRLTISSQLPFFGMGTKPPSEIVDVAVVDDEIALSKGLYSPVNLQGDLMPVAPLAEPDGEDAFQVTLVRGAASEDAESPAMVSATDEGEDAAKGAKLVILALSVAWLPQDFANQLVANMAEWMLE